MLRGSRGALGSQADLSRSPARSAGRSREKTLCAGAAPQSSRQEVMVVWAFVREEAHYTGEWRVETTRNASSVALGAPYFSD